MTRGLTGFCNGGVTHLFRDRKIREPILAMRAGKGLLLARARGTDSSIHTGNGMRTLYLHVGHSKTGSSFLQASFANSIDRLAECKIDYPGAPSEAAAGWKISSGNGQALLTAAPESFEINENRVFFSAERLFLAFAQDRDWPDRLQAMCAHHDIQAVEVLMFLRDPITHAESSYQQMVKRGGLTQTVESVFNNYAQPELVRDALTRSFGELPITWRVYNYDRRKTELLELTEDFLGIPQGTLVRGGDRPVNRSMTAGELSLLRVLNGFDAPAAARLADAWCNDSPEIPSETVFPAPEVQQAMLDRLRPAIMAVDSMVDPSEAYGVDIRPAANSADTFAFSAGQIAAIGDVLGARMQDLSAQLQIEKARRQINQAKTMVDQSNAQDAAKLLDRAEAALQELPGEGDVVGLRKAIARLKVALETVAAG